MLLLDFISVIIESHLLLSGGWLNWRSKKLFRVRARLQWLSPVIGALSWDQLECYKCSRRLRGPGVCSLRQPRVNFLIILINFRDQCKSVFIQLQVLQVSTPWRGASSSSSTKPVQFEGEPSLPTEDPASMYNNYNIKSLIMLIVWVIIYFLSLQM